MKKKLQLLFTFALIYFVSADLSAQVYLLTDKTDIDCNSPTGSITVYMINEFLNPPPYTYKWSNGADTSTISNLGPGTYSVLVTDANKQTGYASVTINAYKAIAVQTNASCSGAPSGSATVAVKNGSGSYSYSWNTVPEQTTQSVTDLAAGSYTVTVTDNSLSNCKTTASVNIKLNPSVPTGDPDVYGSNLWNVYAWNEGTLNSLAWSSAYSGYFTADALDFNSEDYFEDYDVPSSVANYQGCPVNGDNHSWSAKRKGFPCGYYKIDIPMHDDWVRLYIDGQIVFQDNNCCESHTNVWEGFLNSESKVEFRIAEERGQSRGSIKFNLIEPTAVIVNASCYGENDGSISLTPITADTYAYEWENGLTEKDRTGLSAGNYTVIITMPNGCTETKTYTVSQPNALTVTATQSDVTGCHGGNNGSITATVAGGSGNYTYQWNTIPVQTDPALTGLSAGTYTVTVTDANSCQTSKSFTIAEPSAISGTAVITNVSCNGGDNGAIDFTPTGGNGSYTYNWGDGVTTQDRTGLTAGTYSVTVTDSNNCNQTINNIVVGQPAEALTASPVAQTNIACRGGSTGSATATVTAAGGAGGYTYSWAPSGGTAAAASGLAAGTYTVTVTDANNCQASQAFTIIQPAAALTATAGTINNTSCYGGSNGTATVIASGGTPNYSYSWNTSPVQTTATASGLSAGTYTVTVTDANGCQATRSFTISEPSALTIAPSQTNVSCNGGTNGTATAAVSGGTGAYTYSWSPTGGNAATASGLQAGTYTVTVTDANNCQAAQSFTIAEPAILSASKSQTDVLCNGGATGTASVTVSGGSGNYTYSWSPSGGTAATAAGLTAGTYTVTVADANSCQLTESFTISQPAAPLTATTSQINATCSTGGQAGVSPFGGTPGYSYLWSPGGETAPIITGKAAGNYICIITDANGCSITKNFTIGTANTLVASTAQTNVLCSGSSTGSATVIPSGAPGPFTYVWSPFGGNSDTAVNLSAGNYSVTVTSSNGCSIAKTFTITEPSAISAVPAQTDVTCNGGNNGSASVAVTGGTGAYTYSWAPSGGTAATATGLSAGTYTVTITDANLCTKTESFTITEPDAITAAISKTDVSCNGGANGSAAVAASGGTGSYTYAWAPSGGTAAAASGLSAGTYTVTITDANGCSAAETVTIDEPALLAASIAKTDVLCSQADNGTATVTASGGTGPYTYSWSPSGGTAAAATGLSPGTYTVTVTDANGCFIAQTVQITEPAALSAVDSQTNVSCNGGNDGSASVAVTGGTGAYTYLWAPSGGTAATAAGLSAGTYTVTITDANSCSAVNTITITEPDALALTATSTDVSCSTGANGSASVAVTGGTGAYTYSWAPSGGTAATATGLSAGNYTVTVTDANSCSANANVIINEPTALTASISKTNVSCNGGTNGSAAVSVTGGTGAYTYLWAPSGGTAATASGLIAGTYTVTVTDANLCQTTETVTIDEPAALTASTTKTDVLCSQADNGTATVTASGGTGPYTYSWSPSGGTAATAAGLAPGNYTVTVTDANGCFITETIQITEPAVLLAVDSQINVSCNGGNDGTASVAVSGGTGSYTYLWSPSGGTAPTAAGLSAGTYTVTVTDANSCSTDKTITITEPDALALTAAVTDVLCNGGSDGSASVAVTGGTGAYTYLWAPSGGTAAAATGLAPGNYTVTVTDANGCFTAQTVQIAEPAALSAAYAQTNVSCHGGNDGSATVNVTGGTGTYTYLWAPSGGTAATASGLSAGIYTVTVTDSNLCSTANTITIAEPDALTLVTAVTQVSCHGGNNGSAIVYPSGGSGSYTFLWSPSGGTSAIATGLSAGTYSVIVTDANSCAAAIDVVIAEPANPVSLNTSAVSGITAAGASLSGTVSSDGINADTGECLTEAGFVYALHTDPTTADAKINAASALGTFTGSLAGLRGNRTYYVRTYAVNSSGFVNYGNEVSFTTEKYTLTITASAGQTKVYGTADPVFGYKYLGLANGDAPSVIAGLLSRDAGENAGKYNIKLGTVSAGADYIIVFEGAEFEITKADQTITWDQTLEFGCSDSNSLALTATADSGLPVSYTSADPALAAVTGTALNIAGAGSTTITAVQNGDQNHNPAVAVVKTIEISQSGLVVQQWANVLFFDNRSNNYVAWQWYRNGAAVSGATRQYYSELQPLNGTYHVIAKDRNGNSIKSCPIETAGTVFTKKIKIFPNPVKPAGEFTLECDFSESQLNGAEIAIFDITGKLVQTISNVKASTQITAPAQAAIYVVVLKLADGQIKTINLLVK